MNPGKWNDKFPKALEKHLLEGNSFLSFAGVAGVVVKTLYEWVDKHPEFKKAKDSFRRKRAKLYP